MPQFIRHLALVTATARRFLLLGSAHFYDNHALAEIRRLASASKAAFLELADGFGDIFSEKHRPMSSRQRFLGHEHSTQPLLCDAALTSEAWNS